MVYNYFAKNIALFSYDILLGMQVSKHLKFLEDSQWWKLNELEEYQNRRLRSLINHAYKNVPYYHHLFKSLNLDPTNIQTIEDLNRLPILTKEDIRKDPKNFLAQNIKKSSLIKESTSGSSGKVFEFYVDKNLISISQAMGMRGWEFAGYNLGDRIVTIAGSSILPKNMSLLKKIRFKTSRNLPLSSYNMNDDKVKNYVKQIKKFRPKFIRGYPSSIAIIADYMLRNNIYDIKPSAIMTTAETLYNINKKIMVDAFNCDVFDQCGCHDGGENLTECKEHVGYHVGVERAIHEFINEKNEQIINNENGHIILTDLWNYTMPLIRYNAGDMCIPTEEICPCGRGLPLVKSITGRMVEQIVLPSGNLIPGLILTDIFEKEGITDKIIDYQIIQEKIDEFTINIVKNESYTDDLNLKISKFFEGHMGLPLTINFKFVDTIPLTNANKRRVILSKIKRKLI